MAVIFTKDAHVFALSPDRNVLAVGRSSKEITDIFNFPFPLDQPSFVSSLDPESKPPSQKPCLRPVTSLAFSADGTILVAGFETGGLSSWDFVKNIWTGYCDFTPGCKPGAVTHLAIDNSTPGATTVAASFGDTNIRIFDFPSYGDVQRISASRDLHNIHLCQYPLSQSPTPDQPTTSLHMAYNDARMLSILDLSDQSDPPITRDICKVKDSNYPEIAGVYWSPDNIVATTYFRTGAIRLWDATDGRLCCTLNDTGLSFTITQLKPFAIWEQDESVSEPETSVDYTYAVDWASTGDALAACVCLRDAKVGRCFNPEDKTVSYRRPGLPEVRFGIDRESMLKNANGQNISATRIMDFEGTTATTEVYKYTHRGAVTVYNVVNGEGWIRWSIERPELVFDVVFSTNGLYVASAEGAGRICVYCAEDGALLAETVTQGRVENIKKLAWAANDSCIVFLTTCGKMGYWWVRS